MVSAAGKYAIFIARCQPFHNAHAHIIEKVLGMGAKECILCIGSANFERTKKNPFTKAERVEMVKRCNLGPKVRTVTVDDVVRGELYAEKVVTSVLEQTGIRLTKDNTVVATVTDGRSDIYVEEAFNPMECREANSLGVHFGVVRVPKMQGGPYKGRFPICEKIVEMIFENNAKYKEFVPAGAAEYIESIRPAFEGAFQKLYGVRYLNPIPTSDLIIERKTPSGKDGIVLIERKNHPLGHALPGGFVEYGEDIYESARREGMEETNLDITELRVMNVYGRPERDSRDHVQTTAFVVPLGSSAGEMCGGDDAATAQVFALDDLPTDLVFDHQIIVDDYLRWKKSGAPLFFGKKFDSISKYCM